MKIKTKEMGGIRQRDIEIRTADVVGRKIDRADRKEIESALKHQLSASDRRKWDRMATHEKEKMIRDAVEDRDFNRKGGGLSKASSFLSTNNKRGANTQGNSKNTQSKMKNAPDGDEKYPSNGGRSTAGGSTPDGSVGNLGAGATSSVREGATSGTGSAAGSVAESTVKAGAEVTKDAAATAASAGTHAAVKAVKKSLEVAKKIAKSVKQKMEPKDYEAQNRRMGYGQPMEQNANGTTGSRKAVDKVKPLIAAASISVMPIVVAISMTVMILFLFMAPLFGFGSTDAVYPPSEAMADGDYALIKAEMEQYIGMPYVWAGDRPETSFDCSGLTAWVYGRALGISLPHSAQGQYDMSTPVAPEDAKPGDLVFFHSTYETEKYVTHVGIYAGEGIMFEAGGGGIKYTDFTTAYWVNHFVGFGRVNGTSDQIVSR